MASQVAQQNSFIVSAEKTAASQEKTFNKIAGKNSETLEKALENMETALETVEEIYEELAESEEEVSQAAEEAENHMEEVDEEKESELERFEEEVETAAEEFAEEGEGRVEETEEDTQALVEELAEKAEREAETATRTVEDFEIKGAAAVKKYEVQAEKNTASAAKALERVVPKLAPVNENVGILEKAVEDFVSQMEKSLASFTTETTSQLETLKEEYLSGLGEDSTAAEAYLKNKAKVLESIAKEKTATVESETKGKMQQTELDFDAGVSGIKSTLESADTQLGSTRDLLKKTEDRVKVLEVQLENLQKPKEALKKLVDDAVKLGQDKTTEAQGIEAQQLYSLREIESKQLSALGELKTASSDAVAVARKEIGDGIKEESRSLDGEVNQLATQNSARAAEIDGEMVTTQAQMEDIVKAYTRADKSLTEYPGKMEQFKNDFIREMESLNFSIDETANTLGAYTDEKFKEAQDSLDASVNQMSNDMALKIEKTDKKVTGIINEVQTQIDKSVADATEDRESRETEQRNLDNELSSLQLKITDFTPTVDRELQKLTQAIKEAETKITKAAAEEDKTREDVRIKYEKKISEFETAHKEKVADIVQRLADETADARKKLEDELEIIIKNQESTASSKSASMTQTINNVKGKLTELSSRVKEIEEAMDTQGLGNLLEQAHAALEEAEKASNDANGVVSNIAYTQQGIMDDMYSQLGNAENSFQTTVAGMEQTAANSMQEFKNQEGDEQKKFQRDMASEQANSAQAFKALYDSLTESGARITATQRMVQSAAASSMSTLSSAGTNLQRSAAQQEAAVQKASAKARSGASESSYEIAKYENQLKQEEAEDAQATMDMESTANGILGELDTDNTGNQMQAEVEGLKKKETETQDEESALADNANRVVHSLATKVTRKLEAMSRAITSKNNLLQEAGRAIPREFDAMEAKTSEDQDAITEILSDLYSVTSELKHQVSQREAKVKQVHEENEQQLASMQGMSDYSDADKLSEVLGKLTQWGNMDAAISNTLNNEFKPKMERWYQGIATVFNQLGQSLSLEKVEETAQNRMAEQEQMEKEMARAKRDLENFLRTQEALQSQKVNMDVSLSAEEKMKKIKQIEAMGKAQQNEISELASRMADDQRMVGMSIQERKQFMDQMLERANRALEMQRNPPEDNTAYMQKIRQQLTAVQANLGEFANGGGGSFLELKANSTKPHAWVSSPEGQAAAASLLELRANSTAGTHRASLEEAAQMAERLAARAKSHSSRTDAARADSAAFLTNSFKEVVQSLRKNDQERDKQVEKWESLLDGLDEGLQKRA